MIIPKVFKDMIDNNQEISGVLYSTISKFEQIIKDSKFEFFDEYSNHGVEHIENVLCTAEWLISDETYALLNSKDILILVLSVLLHDLGMHLTHEGFLELISGSHKDRKIHGIDEKQWLKEWEDFLKETKQWDDKKIIKVFGEKINITTPSKNREHLTGYDKKLIGEFIRRMHPRIAHEIAIYGFPTFDGETIPFAEGLSEQLRDLSGLVARSHGMDLRNTFEYLEKRFTRHSWKTPHEIKVIFLMVVLRISDFLHITPDRVTPTYLEIRKYSSPLSRIERDTHKSVEYIHNNSDDPELMYVHGNPPTSELFLKLKKLLRDIQHELDLSWAVLGEVYGSHKNLKNMMIRLRRVQSNIDDVENFKQQVSYLPEKVLFDTNPDLIKLLVAPLYGNNPTYGVRELLQNAIDACREREQYHKNNNEFEEYTPEITISIEGSSQNGYYFVISDNGLGMAEETILNYFFKAGASFRKSETWSKQFINNNGTSKVQRSGRFGVGVLASFLLGEEITVSTRFVNDITGWKFKAKIDDQQIEVLKDEREVGTTIKIALTTDTLNLFKRDVEFYEYCFTPSETYWYTWHRLPHPKIKLCLPNTWKGANEVNEIIENFDDVKGHQIYPDGYQVVSWDYEAERRELLCNGILIPDWERIGGYEFPTFPIKPRVVVSDFDGRLPMSLNRDKLDGRLPFSDELAIDVCRDLLAKLFLQPDIKVDMLISKDQTIFRHPSLKISEKNSYITRWGENELLLHKNGYVLPHSYFLQKLSIREITKVWLKKNAEICIDDFLSSNRFVSFSRDEVMSASDLKALMYPSEIQLDKRFQINSKRFLMKKEHKDFLFAEVDRRMRKDFKQKVTTISETRDWVDLSVDSELRSFIDIQKIENYTSEIDFVLQVEIGEEIPKQKYERNIKDIFSKLLEEYFEDESLIPYNLDERKKLFPKVFKELDKYMWKYLNVMNS
ncbi:molecular chaperone HtpG [Brevibacillus sp. IT-7CA2]|uniref:HD domain-containing protein n=1 Tax=Brevibacillus sp. IT-7CA2 TaxID=3026436 RepID=UPI0039DF833B